jgi:hypothetical protein
MKLLWTVFFLLIISGTITKAENHLWMPGDRATVTAICKDEIALTKTAEKFQENTKQAAMEADEIWLTAVADGECHISQRGDKWNITLLEKLRTFNNMFGQDGMTGELWRVVMITRTGEEFYGVSGVFAKQYVPTKSISASATGSDNNGEWLEGDFVYINSMCEDAQVLTRTGSLYQIATEEAVAQADKIWLDAINRGICIQSTKPFLAKLLKKINTFEDVYGIKDYTGELWSAETQTPAGESMNVYIGIMKKNFAVPKTGFLGEPEAIPMPKQ